MRKLDCCKRRLKPVMWVPVAAPLQGGKSTTYIYMYVCFSMGKTHPTHK